MGFRDTGILSGAQQDAGIRALHIGGVWMGNSKKYHSFDYSLFPETAANNPVWKS